MYFVAALFWEGGLRNCRPTTTTIARIVSATTNVPAATIVPTTTIVPAATIFPAATAST